MCYGNIKNRVNRPVLEIFLTVMRNWSQYPTEIQGSLETEDPLSRHLYALPRRKWEASSGHVMEAQLTVQPALGPCPDSGRKVFKRPFFSSTEFCVNHRDWILTLRDFYTLLHTLPRVLRQLPSDLPCWIINCVLAGCSKTKSVAIKWDGFWLLHRGGKQAKWMPTPRCELLSKPKSCQGHYAHKVCLRYQDVQF